MASHCTYFDHTEDVGITGGYPTAGIGRWIGYFVVTNPDYVWCEWQHTAGAPGDVTIVIRGPGADRTEKYNCNEGTADKPVCGRWLAGHTSGAADGRLLQPGAYDVYAYFNGFLPGTFATVHVWVTGCDDTQPCYTPSGLHLVARGETTAIVAWNGVAMATSHQLQRNGIPSGAVRVPSAFLQDLQPNTTYTIRVNACNAKGCSGWSAPLTFTTLAASGGGTGGPTPPPPRLPAPANLRVRPGSISQSSLFIDWDPVPGAVTYGFKEDGAVVGSGPASPTTAYLHGLAPGSTHSFTVFAWNPSSGIGFDANPVTFQTAPASGGGGTGGGPPPPAPHKGLSGSQELLLVGAAGVGAYFLVRSARRSKPVAVLPAAPAA